MRNFFVIYFFLLITLTPLSAAYKILVNSYDTKQSANKEQKLIKNLLQKNNYFKSHQDDEGYEVYSRKLGKFFIVTVEPFENKKVLNKILKLIRKRNKSAFISNSSKKQKIKALVVKKIEPKIVEPKVIAPVVVAPTKIIAPIIDNSKYLRKNRVEEPNNQIDYQLYAGIILLLLLIGTLIWLLKRKKIKNSDALLSEILLEEQAQKQETVTSTHTTLAFNELKVDLHSHLIPGIDDGSKTMEESLALIKKLKSFGYEKIITTPHIMMHRFPNSSKIIQSGLATLQETLRQERIDIQIEAAAEYYLDEHLMELIKNRDILTFGENYLLFEMSYINHPANLEEMVRTMIEAGYTPVLAHPERYIYMSKNFSKYVTLKALGVRFQLNINSLAGYYSQEVKQIANKLIDAGMINFIGSDAHRMRHLDTMEGFVKSKAYQELFQKNDILNNTL